MPSKFRKGNHKEANLRRPPALQKYWEARRKEAELTAIKEGKAPAPIPQELFPTPDLPTTRRFEERISDEKYEKFKDYLRAHPEYLTSKEAFAIGRAYYQSRLLEFARRVFPQHVTDESSNEIIPFSGFHQELADLLASDLTRLGIAAPRGHAKSTITSFFYILHAALYGHKKNIVIVSSSEDMAVRFLRRIKAELEFNNRLLAMFGPQRTEKWSETEIVLQNSVTIHAKGRGAQLRGLISGSRRPDLIVLDDIEDEELVRSEIRRADLEAWFNGTVIPTLAPKIGQLVFIGTILHQDSLLNNVLTNYKEFTTKKYSALLPDDTPLWPERFTQDSLLAIRDSFASRNQLPQFFMEYMNDPTPESTAFFGINDWGFFDKNRLLESKKGLVVEVAVDLGGGSVRTNADDTVIIVGATDPQTGVLYIIDLVADQMGTDTRILIENLFRIYNEYHPVNILIEKTMATNFIMPTLTHEMQMRNIHLPIKLVTPPRGVGGAGNRNMSDAKFQRISALVQPVKNKDILILPSHMKLITQSASFPRGKHDDALDALAYLWMFGFKTAKLTEKDMEDLETPAYVNLYDEIGL